MSTLPAILRQSTDQLITGVVTILPRLVSGLLFLLIAYLLIKLILRLVQTSLNRVLEPDQTLITQLVVIMSSIFLWFGVALAFLKIVGMGDIATSIGTSVGFIALGVSYALSNMIADTVAGVYLLRDPDFNPGDVITTNAVTGTVAQIGLRKSRFHADTGDIVVLANSDVEKRWTKQTPRPEAK